MQKLLKIVQEFTACYAMQINVKKTYLFVINNDKKRREQEPAPLADVVARTAPKSFWVYVFHCCGVKQPGAGGVVWKATIRATIKIGLYFSYI